MKSIQKKNKKIEEILNVDFSQWLKWVSFINEEKRLGTMVSYHTYHGTKGEEYDNVVIIMEHNFGGNHAGRDKFKDYFLHIQKSPEEQENAMQDLEPKKKFEKKFENTQNLIYVACSRARKNLYFLYLDDISEIEDGIKKLFNEIYKFDVSIANGCA